MHGRNRTWTHALDPRCLSAAGGGRQRSCQCHEQCEHVQAAHTASSSVASSAWIPLSILTNGEGPGWGYSYPSMSAMRIGAAREARVMVASGAMITTATSHTTNAAAWLPE